MDYQHFFRPVGFALDVLTNFPVPIDANNNANAVDHQQDHAALLDRFDDIDRTVSEDERRTVRRIWCFGLVPLPLVNYTFLWRRYRPASLRQAVFCITEMITTVMKKLLRAFLYIMSVYFWLRFISISIASCGNMVTFSQSFFSDILTFSLRNYPSLLPRHCEFVFAAKAGKFSGVSMESTRQYMFDIAALKIHGSCLEFDGAIDSELVTDSLIFKLSEILQHCYPIWDYLPPGFHTVATITVYVVYALGAQILNINIVALVTFITWQRQLPLTKFFIEIVKTLWNGCSTVL